MMEVRLLLGNVLGLGFSKMKKKKTMPELEKIIADSDNFFKEAESIIEKAKKATKWVK